MAHLEEDMSVFGMKFEGWRKAAQKAGIWFRRVEEGAELFMRDWHKTDRHKAAERRAKTLRQRHPPSASSSGPGQGEMGRGGGGVGEKEGGKGGRHAQETDEV